MGNNPWEIIATLLTQPADINYLEESSGGPEIIVATLPKSDQIVFLEMNSRLHEDNLSKVIDLAVKSCQHQ
jgi:exosome complex component RRP41